MANTSRQIPLARLILPVSSFDSATAFQTRPDYDGMNSIVFSFAPVKKRACGSMNRTIFWCVLACFLAWVSQYLSVPESWVKMIVPACFFVLLVKAGFMFYRLHAADRHLRCPLCNKPNMVYEVRSCMHILKCNGCGAKYWKDIAALLTSGSFHLVNREHHVARGREFEWVDIENYQKNPLDKNVAETTEKV